MKVTNIESEEDTCTKNFKKFQATDFCPIRDILSRLGDKWSILVLVSLHVGGTMRFSDINRAVPDISQRMLTVTLRSLEADGLVTRRIYPEVPPRVEYTMTAMGESLMPHIDRLVDWATENRHTIWENRNNTEAI